MRSRRSYHSVYTEGFPATLVTKGAPNVPVLWALVLTQAVRLSVSQLAMAIISKQLSRKDRKYAPKSALKSYFLVYAKCLTFLNAW